MIQGCIRLVKKNAINDLEEDPLIKSVEIHKQLPNTLNVDITENEIIALVKYKGKYLPLLEMVNCLKVQMMSKLMMHLSWMVSKVQKKMI